MGISMTQLLVIFVIVLLLFGTKKLRSLGSDLGNAVKGFRDSMKDGEQENNQANQATPPAQQETPKVTHDSQGRVIEGEVAQKTHDQNKV